MSDQAPLPSPPGCFDKPVLITVAPNGAQLSKKDHPQLPQTAEELAACALACQQAGAAMLHLHARDEQGKHSLDPVINQRFLEVVRDQVGSDMVLQITTESIGLYSPEEQMTLLRHCRPEAASIALRELIPDEEHLYEASDFFAELEDNQTVCQLIIYSLEDLQRYHRYAAERVFSAGKHHLLLVIGRHHEASERSLAALLSQLRSDADWSVCAFGRLEHRLTSAAMALNGDVRVGFENNFWDLSGNIANANNQLVEQSVAVARALNRPLMTAAQYREKFS